MKLRSYAEAILQLFAQLRCCTVQEVSIPLLEAKGRILSQDIIARFDAPAFDNSAMDGYAVCGLEEKSWQLLDVVNAAGDKTSHLTLKPGQAVRIFTGAAIPQGTEAIIIQENAIVENQCLTTEETVKPKQNIRFQAEEYAANDVLIKAGQVLNPAMIAVAASQGLTHLQCYRQLKVSVFSTGNELRPVGEVLQENQIYDSNRMMLLSLLEEQQYFQRHDGGILPDDLTIIRQQLQQAAQQNDVVVISGGASVGDKDFTRQALEELGEIHFWRVAIKPGKPFAWGKIGETVVFLLPGNPVASWVTYLILALPALRRLAGFPPSEILVKSVDAIAQFNSGKAIMRQQYLRGTVSYQDGRLFAHTLPNQGSAMLAGCADANALIIIPPQTVITTGQTVQVLLLEHFRG